MENNNPLEQFNTNPVAKYTLKEWISHPTTILLVIAVNIIWILVVFIVWNAGEGKDDCMKRVESLENEKELLKNRITKLEEIQDGYIKSILFKDQQIKTRESIIDSLSRKDGMQ